MKVLIADDDSLVRSALKRILIRNFDCAVLEAENGLEALDLLRRSRVSFALIDIDMPMVSGFELLQAIRASQEHATLPVAMISGVNNEATVRDVIRLGVSDYFVKPLKSERIVTRLTTLIQVLGRVDAPSRARSRPPTLNERTPVLVVDSDGEFRHFFSSLVGPRWPVLQAERGTEVLESMLDRPPAVAFIGADTGLLGPELLARKLRSAQEWSATRLVAVVPRGKQAAMHATGLFDDVFVRTYVPQLFDEQLAKWSAASASHERLTARYPNVRLHLIAATEQALGMMAGCEVSLVDTSPEPIAGEGVEALVHIDTEDRALSLDVALACSDAAASVVAARLLGMNGADVSEQDRYSSIAEIANVITGRLQKGFVEHGYPARCSLPSTAPVRRIEAVPAADVVLDFESADQAITFTVTMRVVERASSQPVM